jgi:hypothetical protein
MPRPEIRVARFMLGLALVWALGLGVATRSLLFPAVVIAVFALAMCWAAYAISLTAPERGSYDPRRRAIVLRAGLAATVVWIASLLSPLVAGGLEPWAELAALPALAAAVLALRLLLSVPFPPAAPLRP